MKLRNLVPLAVLALSSPAFAQDPVCEPGGCSGSISGVFLCGYKDVLIETGNYCVLENCQKPQVRQLSNEEEFPFTQLVVGPNQNAVTNEIRLMAEIIAPYNNFANDRDRNRNASPNGQLDVHWFRTGSGYPDSGKVPPPPWLPAPDTIVSLCEDGTHDKLLTGLTQASTCAELHDAKGGDASFRYGFRAQVCGGPCPPFLFDQATQTCPGSYCGRWTDFEFETVFNATQINGICPEVDEGACGSGSQHGVNENGDLALEFPDSGPGAIFRYRHGGVGWPGGPEEKRDALGRVTKIWQHYSGLPRGWSHDYAKTLVKGREPGHAWLITESGTYRSFWQVGGNLRSDLSLPSDDERYLEPAPDGTIHLVDVDGSRDIFYTNDPGNPYSDAHWIGWQDANGNKKTATFAIVGDRSQMIVTMPDGRKEIFTYTIPEDDEPKTLLSLTEVGIDGTTTRVWRYNGMSRIEMPDGRKRELRHTATGLSNVLVGLDGSERVEGSWTFDEWGNVIEATGGGGTERLTFTYDKPWNPRETRVTDAYGKTTLYRFSRDPSTNAATLLEVNGACPSCGTGAQVKYRYEDPANPLLPTTIFDGKDIATSILYDGKGQVRSVEEAVGTPLERATTIERGGPFPVLVTRVESASTSAQGSFRESIASYDAKGNPEIVSIAGIEAGGSFTAITQAVFSPEGLPTSIDPPGHGQDDIVYFTYDEARGFLLPLSRTDPLLGTTNFTYDALNRLSSVLDVNGVETTFLYDDLDRLIELRRKGANASEDLVTAFTYTPKGDLFQVMRPEGNLVEYGYDIAGRVMTIDRKSGNGVAFDRTSILYNAAGQSSSVQTMSFDGTDWNAGATTTYLRSSRCQLDGIEDALGKKTEFSYDCNQNLEKVWDANHPRVDFPTQPTTTYSWDVLNRLTSVSEPWAGGGAAVTRFGYDVQDHLVEVVDAVGHVTSYVWSDRDRMTSEVSEYSGTTTHRYDEAGERVETVDARGIEASFVRDALGRVMAIDYPGTAEDTQLIYDAGGAFSTGRLSSLRRGSTALDYRFDRFGRLTREGALTYGYDGNSRRTRIDYPNGIEARYAFDHADRPRRLTLVEPGQGGTTIVEDAAYEAMGPLARLELGNGVTEERAFDARFHPTRIEATRGALSLQGWTYQTDALGNILSITDEADSSKSRIYGYQDFAYFLSSAEGSWGSLSWEYSKIGDRLAEVRDTERTVFRETVATVDEREWMQRLIEPPGGPKTTFWFDAAGNQVFETSGNRKLAFEYGNDNRLARIALEEPGEVGSKTELSYDGRGYLSSAVKKLPSGAGWVSPVEAQRLGATYGGSTLFHRFSESLPSVLSAHQAETRQSDDYVLYFAGRPVAILSKETVMPWGGAPTSSRKLLLLTTDHLGTPTLATSESGATLWSGGFEPYGGDHAGASAAGVFLRFPGQWVDDTFAGSEQTYNLNRWYDNKSGRYTQADPIGLASGPNLYGYVFANPVNWHDVHGLQPERYHGMMREWVENPTIVEAQYQTAKVGTAAFAAGVVVANALPAATACYLSPSCQQAALELLNPNPGQLTPISALEKGAVCTVNAITEGHHPLPKFLGGFQDQDLIDLPRNIHRAFHSALRLRLKEAGIPLSVGGRGGSAADWARYFNANPGSQRTAFDAVMDASREIDYANGTTVTQSVWNSALAGDFTSIP